MQAIDDKQQAEALNRVIEVVRDLTRRRVSSVVIFDLDGTVLDNRPRTLYILREIAEYYDAELPQLWAAMEKPQGLNSIAYTLADTLARIGVDDPREVAFIEKEWGKRFFTDTYQRFDFPLPGAKRFVEEVHAAGATVVYLTGRDVSRMLVGTIDSLRQFGFPVGIAGTMTVVKTDIEQDDAIFKQDTVEYLQRLGTVVAVFENEPANSNLLLEAFPYADSFLLLTHHRPDAPSPDPRLVQIKNFQRRG